MLCVGRPINSLTLQANARNTEELACQGHLGIIPSVLCGGLIGETTSQSIIHFLSGCMVLWSSPKRFVICGISRLLTIFTTKAFMMCGARFDCRLQSTMHQRCRTTLGRTHECGSKSTISSLSNCLQDFRSLPATTCDHCASGSHANR